FISRTRPGRAMRAVAQDPEAARLMGINVNNTISLTFLLGGMLAGAAGLVYALYETTIWYFQGFRGGLLIGLIQQIGDNRIAGGLWTEAIVFGYLILVMVLQPRGLLGEETREA